MLPWQPDRDGNDAMRMVNDKFQQHAMATKEQRLDSNLSIEAIVR
jgi:hypothetical protein